MFFLCLCVGCQGNNITVPPEENDMVKLSVPMHVISDNSGNSKSENIALEKSEVMSIEQ